MAQTPQQRRANEKYAKAESQKRGKPAADAVTKIKEKSPISPIWLGLLLFVLLGGIFLELFRWFV